MAELILFGGTTEGRELAALLKEKGADALVCVATEYGEALAQAGGSVRVRSGRLDEAGMEALFEAEAPRAVIDATHPYALEAGENIRAACGRKNIRYIRVEREEQDGDGCLTFGNTDALAGWLSARGEAVFSTLGAKEAPLLAKVTNFKERVWLRILPSEEGLSACLAAGFPPAHIICMQGPFSRELNAAMFRTSGAGILVTKDSGPAGGFPEKLAAAKDCGMTVAVIARPKQSGGVAFSQAQSMIKDGTI